MWLEWRRWLRSSNQSTVIHNDGQTNNSVVSHGSKKLRSEDKVWFYLSFLREMLREFLLKCPGLVIIVALGDNVYPQHTYIMHLHKVCCNNTMCGPKKYVAPGPPLSGSSTVVSVISLTAGETLKRHWARRLAWFFRCLLKHFYFSLGGVSPGRFHVWLMMFVPHVTL